MPVMPVVSNASLLTRYQRIPSFFMRHSLVHLTGTPLFPYHFTDRSPNYSCFLNSYGITEARCNFVSDYIKHRHQAVRINNILSDTTNVKSGVPQGGCITPLLFLLYIYIYINDNVVLNSSIYLYADNFKIHYSHGRSDKPVSTTT